MKRIQVKEKGQTLLNNPLLNKGMAFSNEERERFGLHGLIPYHVASIEEQVARRYENFSKQSTPLAKYLFLSALQNNNEVLFYRLVVQHIVEMLPYIYTPTVGDASLAFSSIYTQRRGLYLSYPHRHKMEEMIANFSKERVDVMVVTDGERILGLGDLGANGMAISVGKVALYSVFGGIYPGYALPVFLDVGTNNESLLEDPLYLGWRSPRVKGKEYDDFIESFVCCVKKIYPHVLLQWEDFSREHAFPLLERYRERICSFNDDIQGTAAVVLAAILTAVHVKGERLQDQRIALLGAGSAGLGICRYLLLALQEEGLSLEEALRLFYLVDREGLIHDQLSSATPDQKQFARPHQEVQHGKGLLDVVRYAHPTILIGVSAQPATFTEEIVKEMAKHVLRPIICPLSNPITCCEAVPSDLIRWTRGKALIATGSPFAPVNYQERTYPISQCNNVYIFPGIGLGTLAVKARAITDKMFLKAANSLKEYSPALKDPFAPLFPPLEQLPAITKQIAIAVALAAQEEGVASLMSDQQTVAQVSDMYWEPAYPEFYRNESALS